MSEVSWLYMNKIQPLMHLFCHLFFQQIGWLAGYTYTDLYPGTTEPCRTVPKPLLIEPNEMCLHHDLQSAIIHADWLTWFGLLLPYKVTDLDGGLCLEINTKNHMCIMCWNSQWGECFCTLSSLASSSLKVIFITNYLKVMQELMAISETRQNRKWHKCMSPGRMLLLCVLLSPSAVGIMILNVSDNVDITNMFSF